MNILQLCLRVPFPPKDGAAIAMNNMARGIVECGHQLTVLAVNTPKHYVNINVINPLFLNGINFKSVDINTEVKPLGAIASVLTPGHSYNISRFFDNRFDELLAETLKNSTFNCVIVESLFMAPYLPTIRKYSKAKVVLRSHNVEYTIWQKLAENATNPIKKWYLSHLTKRLKQYEIETSGKFDAIIPISYNDEKIFTKLYPGKSLKTIYCGVSDQLLNTPVNHLSYNSIYHLGSMDWMPNIEAINWFLKDIWPLILKENKDVKCYLAGRKMPDDILAQKNDRLIVESFVEDALGYQQKNGIMIVPLITGGGIRIKILEGLALGKVIVTTSKGVEGIPAEHGKQLLIADNAIDFAQMVLKCVADHEYCKYISANARVFAGDNFSNKQQAQQLIDFINNLN